MTDADGTPLPDAPVAWSVVPSGVVSVDSSGLVTSVGNGTAQLTATSGSASGEVTVAVSQVPISLTHDGDIELNVVGKRSALDPFAVDSNGVRITPPSMFSYQSSAPGVASVDIDGVVTANYFGEATVTASLGGMSTTSMPGSSRSTSTSP